MALFLGSISFSLYMVHYLWVNAFYFLQTHSRLGIPGEYFSAGAAVTALLSATVICIFVEEPLRRYGRRQLG
jgi:peptidoglycan/LPS O-acetylase OafA/YrhL